MWLEAPGTASNPFIHTWLAHQLRDDYWKHGSVCEDYGAIRAAVLAVGGWHDPYRDTVLRLVHHLPADRVRGLIGPWSHQYPDRGLPPGPAIGFLQETLRWWDQLVEGRGHRGHCRPTASGLRKRLTSSGHGLRHPAGPLGRRARGGPRRT
ncbi:CocE/NonD family hydrolase [Streptomyces sp. L7]